MSVVLGGAATEFFRFFVERSKRIDLSSCDDEKILSQLIDYKKIEGATDTLSMVAPDIEEYPLLWIPILGDMADYKDVMIDDVYDLVDLDRMIAALEYKKCSSAYNDYVLRQEQNNLNRKNK